MKFCWLWMFSLGCFVGLQGCSIPIEVQAQEEIVFKIDLDKIIATNKINKAKLFPGGKLPPDYKLQIPFWFTTNYDLSGNAEIKKRKDQIRNMRLRKLTYKATENTLSVDIPSYGQQLKVYLAEHGKKETKDFTQIGFFFPIPHKRLNFSDRLQLEDNGETTAGGYFKQLKFTIGLQGVLTLDGSQSTTIPSGRITLKVLVDVIFTVDVDF